MLRRIVMSHLQTPWWWVLFFISILGLQGVCREGLECAGAENDVRLRTVGSSLYAPVVSQSQNYVLRRTLTNVKFSAGSTGPYHRVRTVGP